LPALGVRSLCSVFSSRIGSTYVHVPRWLEILNRVVNLLSSVPKNKIRTKELLMNTSHSRNARLSAVDQLERRRALKRVEKRKRPLVTRSHVTRGIIWTHNAHSATGDRPKKGGYLRISHASIVLTSILTLHHEVNTLVIYIFS